VRSRLRLGVGLEPAPGAAVKERVSTTTVVVARDETRPRSRRCTRLGLIYGLVATIGLIDGEDALDLIPISSADNLLQVALAARGMITLGRGNEQDESGGDVDQVVNRVDLEARNRSP
jgi:hypothetical protein